MRRKDREITDPEEIDAILGRCRVCRLAFAVEDTPYIVPLNFGFRREDGRLTLFFHGAKEGRKLDMMARNPRVCFETDGMHRLMPDADHPEKCTMAYESVVGWGTARLLTDAAERRRALDCLMAHYGAVPKGYPEAALRAVAVFSVAVSECTGKRHEPR